MAKKRILVACDAGAAGRELLTRKDLELGWALTSREADAWMARGAPDVVLVREELATEVLELLGRRAESAACVVLLEPDGWERRNRYFDLGARGLVQASSRERILEAVSNLTGLAFPTNARVPFRDVVEVTWRGTTLLLETRDISVSGVAVCGMPGVMLGERIRVSFVMSDSQVAVDGVVVRQEKDDGELRVGVSFADLDEGGAADIQAIIEGELDRLPELPDPVGMTCDLAGTFTLDLNSVQLGEARPEESFRQMLTKLLAAEPGDTTRYPRWLDRVAAALTPCERASLETKTPRFASDAVDARIRIERARARIDGHGPTQEDCRSVLELSRSLAGDAAMSPDEILADVPKIRAALLLGVYGATRIPPQKASLDKAVNG